MRPRSAAASNDVEVVRVEAGGRDRLVNEGLRCVANQGLAVPPIHGFNVRRPASARLQSQANPATQIAIGHPTKGQALKVVVQVPINVWLPAGVKVVLDDKEEALTLTFKRCTPIGCLADLDISEDLITKLRNLTANGKLQFKDGTQKDVAVPISFKGFGQAFDALSKE